MNGTVAPSSSKPMAATTCVALAAISVAMSWAICCSTDMRESDSFDDMRTAGTAGCDRGCTRICGVDDRLVPATCSVGPLLRAGFEKRQFTRSEEHTSELQSLMR